MKNIAIFIYDYSLLGGAQKVTNYLSELLFQSGFPIKCIISQKKDGNMNYSYSPPVEIIGEGGDMTIRLNEILRKYEIGNVIVQMEKVSLIPPVLKVLDENKCSIFLVLHSSPYYWLKKYYSLDQYISNPKFIGEYIKMKLYWHPLHLRLFRSFVDKYGMICVSRQAQKEMCDIVGLPYNTSKVKYIYNPIQAECVVPERNTKENLIVYAGRLSFEKRPMLMLKMWAQIYKDYPDWKFYILGDGPDKKKMEKYIRSHNVDRVFMTGAVNNVFDYFKKSKISLLFSKYEGLPTSILEAGMCNNGLLVTESDGGTKDIVEDGVNGFVVSSHDIRGITEKLKKMMAYDGALALEMGEANKKCFEKFANENVVKSWSYTLV